MKKFSLYILLLLISCISCIDKFPLGGETYENLLVVDGMFHNGPGTYTVELSRSSSVGDPSFNPVANALVKIMDENGASVVLDETNPGSYQSSSEEMQGIPGHRYKLSIVLANGEMYESSYAELQNTIEIDSVYAKFESNPTADPDINLLGYKFYVNTSQPAADSVFYLWQGVETYKYHAASTIDYTYSRAREPYVQVFENRDSLYYCYKSETVSNFWVKSSLNLSSSSLSDVPINFVSTLTSRISIRYSLLVKQFSITAEAFDYWSAIKEQLTNDDILFNKQVYQVRGNVRNINDPGEPVMGYFTVAGYDEKRIFVDRPEDVDVYVDSCSFIIPSLDLLLSGPDDWPLYLGNDSTGTPAFLEQYCFDCRNKGGKLEKPDFWIDE